MVELELEKWLELSEILHSGLFHPPFSDYMDRAISRDQKYLSRSGGTKHIDRSVSE